MGDQKKELARLNRAQRAARRQGTVHENPASPQIADNLEAPASTSADSAQHATIQVSSTTHSGEHARSSQKKRQTSRAKPSNTQTRKESVQGATSAKVVATQPVPQVRAMAIAKPIEEECSGGDSGLMEGLAAVLNSLSESEYEEEAEYQVQDQVIASESGKESDCLEEEGANEVTLGEPAIVIKYQVPAGNRTRNTNVSSTFSYAEHRRQFAATMGYTTNQQIAALDLAWKLNTAKKSDLPAEFATDRDLKKLIAMYRVAVDKEAGKMVAWKKKVAKGTVKAGTKAPVEVDIVVIITNIGLDKKINKAPNTSTQDNDNAQSVSPDQSKPDTSFMKRARAAYPCALDTKAVCFINPFGEHVHVTPNDINLWEALEKQDPTKYNLREIPRELQLYDKSRRGQRLASPNVSDPSTTNTGPAATPGATAAVQGAMMPMTSAVTPHLTAPFSTSSQPLVHPAMHPAYLGFLSAHSNALHAMYPPGFPPISYAHPFDIPPSPIKPSTTVDYPLITDWLENSVESDAGRIRDGQSYLTYGPLLTQAGFYRINELVDNKYVTVESLQSLGIELGFASNVLRWANDDVQKANRDALRAKRTG
ncbi:hypothetical protein M407DRAFT_12714 [Tulasnella calospora MUT 4182]|uniref:Uncharacterized protein n=1 Tax=Tulasnella calospora MUT 4182 TaxID=1051891 RepID=A0A0C3L4U7_9AGAM|nr:hypothetical protein M407DRAFT_12714 [Tulasnella calospora MUT 4182]